MAFWCPKCKQTVSNDEAGWWRGYDSAFALAAGVLVPFLGFALYSGIKGLLDPPICPECGRELLYDVPKKYKRKRRK